MGRVRDKVVAKQDICIPLQIPFLEWQRPKGQTFFFAETSTKVGLRLPSYCFLPLESSLNLLDHSDSSPVVTRSLLTAPKCHTPLVDAAATVMARSTSVNRLSTFCRHRRLYMLLHRRMPSCFVGPAIQIQGALPLRVFAPGAMAFKFANHRGGAY